MEPPLLNITNVPRISASPAQEVVLRRMRYSARSTMIAGDQMRDIQKHIASAAALCESCGRFARISVNVRSQDVVCDGWEAMRSASLAKLLSGSREAVILGVTIGTEIMETIRSLTDAGRFAEVVIYDAVASETAEAAMEYLYNYVRQERSRFGQGLTRRFSPGYGDLALAEQRKLHESLRMQELGVSLSPRHILIPEKSILAIAGIKEAR